MKSVTAPTRCASRCDSPGLHTWPLSMGRKRGRSSEGSSFTRNGADSQRGSRSNGWLDFEKQPIGTGNSRLAYRCRVRNGCYRGYTEGSYGIFKVFKPERQYEGMTVDERDVDMQVEARRLAETFNHECQPEKHGSSCEIHVRDAALGCFPCDLQLDDDYQDTFTVRHGQEFLLEREIRGHFEKFNSNTGWSSGRDPILEAFSHWSWVHSGGSKLVCDLQGHRGDGTLPYLGKDYYYLLTDPAICSATREYGESDLGQAGIDAFFRNHECNQWCRHLDLEYERPQFMFSQRITKRQSTSYHTLLN